MKSIIVFLMLFVPWVGFSNPYMMEVINEFQTAISDSQRIEFRYFQIPAYDTIFLDQPLLNGVITTPAGTAYIDTGITLPGCGYAVIDTSVLTGSFSLPGDSGFIHSYLPYSWDSICYPCSSFSWKHLIIPAPPAGASAAKYHCWLYDSTEGYLLITDWYIDYTPTFGSDNDDYPGCNISGYVCESGSGLPIVGATVQAILPPYYEVCNYEPYYIACTTHTQSDGSYSLDSLLPLPYYINVSIPGYQSISDSVPVLRALKPLTGFNFYLVGIGENNTAQSLRIRNPELEVYPILFSNNLLIRFLPGTMSAGQNRYDLRIYDATGRLVRQWNVETIRQGYQVIWDGTDDFGKAVSKGAYFICMADIRVKVIRL
ncbi:MAG: FlgD immunoglobulin-like domain containing protein [bacterium]